MYSYGSPHMAAQKQDDQHERTFSSYVRIQVVVLKTYLGRWTIGRSGERGSGISVLPARYDDDDDFLNTLLKRVGGSKLIFCYRVFSHPFMYIFLTVFFKQRTHTHTHTHTHIYIYIYIYVYMDLFKRICYTFVKFSSSFFTKLFIWVHLG